MKILLLLISLSPFLNSQEMYEMEMTFENDLRSYLLYKPINYQDSLPIDLFIGIHGYGGTALDLKERPLETLISQPINIILLQFIHKEKSSTKNGFS